MKKLLSFLLLCTICAGFSLIISCNGNGKIDSKKQKKWNYDLNSYSGLIAAKDGLLNTKPWDEELFDTLLIQTYSNQNYDAIDYNEAFNIYDGIFKGGAHMVLTAVDSTMKTSVYNNLDYWKKISTQIASKTAEYQKIYGALESPNPNLQTVDDMIQQYKTVLSLSRSTFSQTPKSISRYTGSYQSTEDKIKNNRYWKDYFSKNSEINKGISEFPQRVKAAQNLYYSNLKDLIIKRAEQDNVTKQQLSRAISRYQSITTSSEQSLRDELGAFLMKYQSSESQEESNDSFWR